jgi:Cytochrome P450
MAFLLSWPCLNLANGKLSTTAGLLANTWHVLARRPDIWNNLRVEVDALNGRQPTYAEIKDMKYLKYVLNESLRLMPVVPGNSRVAIRDTILPLGGGPDGKSPVLVEAGGTVSQNISFSQMRYLAFFRRTCLGHVSVLDGDIFPSH